MGSRSAQVVYAIIVGLAGAVPAFAQTPAQPPPPEPPPRLEASAHLALLDSRGNSSAQSFGAGGDSTWRPEPWTYSGKAIFSQTESDGELSARSLAALFRASRAIGTRLSVYGQYDFLRNVFAGVEGRHVMEGGVSYLAIDRQRHRLRLDGGLGYLVERRPEEDFDSATLSLAAGYRLAISPTSELTYDPRFLLPLADTAAWKFDQHTALAVSLNTVLSLKLAHTLRYAAEPAAGFETTDTIMAVSLVAKVRRP